MKILFFSDIHGIEDNLEFIKKLDEREELYKIICLGDLYGYNNDISNLYIINFLTSYQDRLVIVRGNNDRYTPNNNLTIYEDFILKVDNLNIQCTHSNNPHNLKLKDILIHGHLHYPIIKQKKDLTFICVGSISIPRRGTDVSYGIYHNQEFRIYNTLEKELYKILL